MNTDVLVVLTILAVGAIYTFYNYFDFYLKPIIIKYNKLRKLKSYKYVDGFVYDGYITDENIIGYYSKTYIFICNCGMIDDIEIVDRVLDENK